jgi:hypothetical protein
MNEKQNPLILVFYLQMEDQRIIQPFIESVNDMIIQKNANIMAFFVPTDGEERIECLNPVTLKENDMDKINKMIEDIKQSFSIGAEMSIPDEDIILDNECICGNNPGGNCKCDE